MKPIPIRFSTEISKAYEDKKKWIVEGYAATSDFDLDEDIILPPALKKAAKDLEKNSTVFFNHDRKRAIGKVIESKFVKTKTGAALKIKVLISKTAPDIWQQIKEGVLNKFSISAKVLDAEKKFVSSIGKIANIIKSIFLLEASLVALPANPKARAIGWHVSKALKDFESEGGKIPMKEEILNLDELEEVMKAEDEEDEEETEEEAINETEEVVEEAGEESKESVGEEVSEAETEKGVQEQEEDEEEEEETEEEKVAQGAYPYPYPFAYPRTERRQEVGEDQTRLSQIFFILDKLIQGTTDKKAVPVLQELKAILDHMVGGTYPYPSPYPYPAPQSKGMKEKDLREIVRDEVSKTVNLRKGLSENEESVKETESSDPAEKLRNVLSKQSQ